MKSLYRHKLVRELIDAQLKEMKRHKWIESEKAGFDLGDKALLDWVDNYSKDYQINNKK